MSIFKLPPEQHLRSIDANKVPGDLLPGQIAFNLTKGTVYVGNGSASGVDPNGIVYTTNPEITPGKGWSEYPLDLETFVDVLTYTDSNGERAAYLALLDALKTKLLPIDRFATETIAGITEYATNQEALNKTITDRSITPANLHYWGTDFLATSTNVKLKSLEQDIIDLWKYTPPGNQFSIYVNVSHPFASDSKTNTGGSPDKPFKSLERGIIEAARRSFLNGKVDSYNTISISLAPGVYNVLNGTGSRNDIDEFYNYQTAAELIRRNLNDISETALLELPTASRTSSNRIMIQDIISRIAMDVSQTSNQYTVARARSWVDKNRLPGHPLYFKNNFADSSFRSSMGQAIDAIQSECRKAAQNLLTYTDEFSPAISSGSDVVVLIYSLGEILTSTLVAQTLPSSSIINPHEFPATKGIKGANFPEFDEPSNGVLEAFNSVNTAGIILPRGVSIVGEDLRKVIIRPTYVPDPATSAAKECSIFRMTGGNFFSGFTVMDQELPDILGSTLTSHHKLSAFGFCTEEDLENYYHNIASVMIDPVTFHKIQDACNLIDKNRHWLNDRIEDVLPDLSTLSTELQLRNGKIHEVLRAETSALISALVMDLRSGTTRNLTEFGKYFTKVHLPDTLVGVDRIQTIDYYLDIWNKFRDKYINRAVINAADTVQGGYVNYDIPIDSNTDRPCNDVITVIGTYISTSAASVLAIAIDSGSPFVPSSDYIEETDIELGPTETEIIFTDANLATAIASGDYVTSVDSTKNSSPYIFSASLRSEYGLCGIHGDGSKVGGLKSFLAAQFTVISLQKDLTAYTDVEAENEVPEVRYGGSIPYDSYRSPIIRDYRHYGYKTSNGSYAQLVSCFCIGPAIHYWADSGGEISITNSTSNFGDISLYSRGFLNKSYKQDKGLVLERIYKPKSIDFSNALNADKFSLGLVAKVEEINTSSLYLILAAPAKNLEVYTLNNPDKANFVYCSSAIEVSRERSAKVTEITHNYDDNGNITTRLTINVTDPGSSGDWNPIAPGDPGYDADTTDKTVVGKTLYIKRFVDTRSFKDRIYSLIVSKSKTAVGKRIPVLHYIITKQVEEGVPQPFKVPYTSNTNVVINQNTAFYVVDIEPTNVLTSSTRDYYRMDIASCNFDKYGNLLYDTDLQANSIIDLDYDPRDSDLASQINKNTYSRQNIDKFISILELDDQNLNVTNNRLIDISASNIVLDTNKPSLIRCSGHTWEYLGYYNYSTALPELQPKKVGEGLAPNAQKLMKLNKVQTQTLGGRIYASGMDEEGNLYRGNTYEDFKTGKTETLLRGTTPEILISEDIELPRVFENLTVTNTFTVTGADVIGMPHADTENYGVVLRATDEDVENGLDSTKYVTPKQLSLVKVDLATYTNPGITETATEAEALAGTDEFRYITPFTLKKSLTAIRPDVPADFSFTYEEGQVAGYLVGQIVPTTGTIENFSITDTININRYTIDNTGKIRLSSGGVNTAANIYNPDAPFFTFDVACSNDLGTTTTTVKITVTDRPNVLKFSNFVDWKYLQTATDLVALSEPYKLYYFGTSGVHNGVGERLGIPIRDQQRTAHALQPLTSHPVVYYVGNQAFLDRKVAGGNFFRLRLKHTIPSTYTSYVESASDARRIIADVIIDTTDPVTLSLKYAESETAYPNILTINGPFNIVTYTVPQSIPYNNNINYPDIPFTILSNAAPEILATAKNQQFFQIISTEVGADGVRYLPAALDVLATTATESARLRIIDDYPGPIPVISGPTTKSLVEGSPAGTLIGNYTATNNPTSWSSTGQDNPLHASWATITPNGNSATLTLSAAGAAAIATRTATNSSWGIEINAANSEGIGRLIGTVTTIVAAPLRPDPPDIIYSIPRSSALNYVIDPALDAGGTGITSVTISAQDVANAFAVTSPGGVFTVSTGFDNIPYSTVAVQVTVDFTNSTATGTATYTVYLEDDEVPDPDYTPVMSDQSFTYSDNKTTSAVLGTLSASNSPTSFTKVGGTHAAGYNVSSNGQIKLASASGVYNNYTDGGNNTFTFTANASNSAGTSSTVTVTMNLTDSSPTQPPVVANKSVSYYENSTTSTAITTMTSTGGTVPSGGWSLSGTYANLFTISNSGAVTLSSTGVDSSIANNYETNPISFSITVNATNTAGSDTATLTLTKLNVDEAVKPEVANSTRSYTENKDTSDVLFTLVSTAGAVDEWFLGANSAGSYNSATVASWFTINSSGEVKLTSTGVNSPANDFEVGPNIFTLNVTATGLGSSGSDSSSHTVSVTNVSESVAPTILRQFDTVLATELAKVKTYDLTTYFSSPDTLVYSIHSVTDSGKVTPSISGHTLSLNFPEWSSGYGSVGQFVDMSLKVRATVNGTSLFKDLTVNITCRSLEVLFQSPFYAFNDKLDGNPNITTSFMVESGEFNSVITNYSNQFQDRSNNKQYVFFYAINNQTSLPQNAGASILITINRYQINSNTGHYIYMTSADKAYYSTPMTNEGVAYRCFNPSKNRGSILYRYLFFNGSWYTSYNYFFNTQNIGRNSSNQGYDGLDGNSGKVLTAIPPAPRW